MRSGSEVRSGRSVNIHPTAIVHPEAEIDEGVQIGPFSIISSTVKIGAGTVVGARVTIEGYTTLGEDNEIFTGAVIGSRTQDKKYEGGVSYLRIGSRNRIREYVTINPGTKEGTETVIGDDNLLMAYAHVAHDCILHNGVTLANVATLAGHVEVQDKAIIGGLSAVHQFVRIGKLALIGGCSKVVQDVPSFMIADGHPAGTHGVNVIGLERAEYEKEVKIALRKAYKIIFRSRLPLKQAIEKIQEEIDPIQPVQELVSFLKSTERGICR